MKKQAKELTMVPTENVQAGLFTAQLSFFTQFSARTPLAAHNRILIFVKELRFLEAAVCIEDYKKHPKFPDQITSDIDKGAACELLLIIEPLRTEMTSEQFSWVIKNLKNEINDQALRRKIKIETENTRNLILAHTFSSLTKED